MEIQSNLYIFQLDLHKRHDSAILIYVIVYILEKWFTTYFELALSTKLCAISLFRSRHAIG